VRVTREQAAANREKILEVAGTLFRERGYDGIGVADIMKRAGLTHGGFYGHFASKDDLAAEITARVLGREGWLERLTGSANPSLADVVRRYLTRRHRDNAGHGCLLAAVGVGCRAAAAIGTGCPHRGPSSAHRCLGGSADGPFGGAASEGAGDDGRARRRADSFASGGRSTPVRRNSRRNSGIPRSDVMNSQQ
jgi:AcrR family transcriptional regulator